MKSLLTNKNYWGYLFITIFVIINSLLIYYEFYYFGILSILAGILFLAFIRLDLLVFLVVLLTPLSVPLSKLKPGLENDIILPTEPLILIVLAMFIFKLLYDGSFDRKILKHPITLAIFFNLIWIFLTSITSTLPVVSFKYLLSRIWFLVTFYFIMTQIFKKYENITKFLWLYILSFIIVIIYCIVKQSQLGITNQLLANQVPSPFFNDHTAYGASLAMIYPVLIHFLFEKKNNLLYAFAIFFLVVLFTAAVILSYSRATWLSLIIGLAIFLVIKSRIKFSYLLITGAIIVVFIITSWSNILMKLEKNKTESSDYIIEHVESMSNVSSDASNLERINRWSCAIRMFKEKPVLGWGPGTYKFKYGAFQLSYQKTIISTNAGILGNAHSEYIGPLCEMGFMGTISILLIVILTIYYSLRLYKIVTDKKTKSLILALLIGLITYYLHGLLNNFLDTDKASCLFWGYTAVFVAIEKYHTNKETNEQEIKMEIKN